MYLYDKLKYSIDWCIKEIQCIIKRIDTLEESSGGVGAYDELSDTPSSKVGSAGKVPMVNDAETLHEYTFIGDMLFTGAATSTVTVNNYPAGEDLSIKTYNDLVNNIYAPFNEPSFTSFSISGQSTTVEVGTTISGNKSFTFGFDYPSNVLDNTIAIVDVTSSTTLASNLSSTSPASVNVGNVQKTAPANNQWKALATDTQGGDFESNTFTVNWYWRFYYGNSTNTTLTEAQVLALSSSSLKANENGTYSFAAGGYKWFVYPDDFGSPTASTGFKDTATNLAVAMADLSDDAFFANTQNGWSYGLISITNTNGITTNCRAYRTKNQLGSSINIQIS